LRSSDFVAAVTLTSAVRKNVSTVNDFSAHSFCHFRLISNAYPAAPVS
jgi:hypothetical protein